MSTPSNIIASQINNCSFSLQSVEKFLDLMAKQHSEYSNISYKANGPFALVLRAKKNGTTDVALKVLECTDRTDSQIQAMEREYAIRKQLPSSDYFMAIQTQFFLKEMNQQVEQDQVENSNTKKKVYFVQQMEMCQGSFQDIILHYSEKNKDLPSETFKEMLAIQMLDAVNLLHQKQMVHGNITTYNFLISSSQGQQTLLKLCNLHFTFPVNPINPANEVSQNQPLNRMFPSLVEIQRKWVQEDLVSLGKVLLLLDNIGTNFDYSIISNDTIAEQDLKKMIETNKLNQNTLLCKIACSFLSNSRESSKSVSQMLLFLLQKQTEALKIPLFSVVFKSQLDNLMLPIPSKRLILDFIVSQITKQHKLNNKPNWVNSLEQRKTQLTEQLLKSALAIMLEWKEFSEDYDVVGVGVGGVIFGVENLVEKRKSVLKLSLCTNKAQSIREIGIMKICQAPHVIKFYGYKFFKDTNGNEFVVYELERCKYSLIHHLELQRIYGEYAKEQKQLLTFQMLDSVSFLHENRIIHRNIKLDSFLITENESGQAVVKLGNFSHAVQLQNNFLELSALENQLLEEKYLPFVNCILQKCNRESPLYFAPERWENPDLSTYLTDSFSLGLCIFLLNNQLICSEEQLARNLLTVPLRFNEISLDMNPSSRIAKHLLMFKLQERKFARTLNEEFTTSQKENKEKSKDEDNFHQQMVLRIENRKVLDDLKQTPNRFANLYSVCFNLDQMRIEDTETKSLLDLISNLHNLSRISFNCARSSNLLFVDKYFRSSLARLVNISSVSFNLYDKSIGDVDAQTLLSPFENLLNLSSLKLNLQCNKIGHIGAFSLLSPLANILNLSSIAILLDKNKIGDIGALSLLAPLSNLFNLSNITLFLQGNQIGAIGGQSLLSPLTNLLNLSSLSIDLGFNHIGDNGAKFLLEPLRNLINLSSLSLDFRSNLIGEIGGQSLLYPLTNLLNLSILNLDLGFNDIGDIGAQFLLSHLANLLNLSSLTINLAQNGFEELGAQSMLLPLENLLNLSSFTLNLEANRIGDIGVQSLLSPLRNLLNLSNLTLHLGFNHIGDIGANSLLSPLSNLLNLSSIILYLNSNEIGYLGAKSLLSPLANLMNLSSLTLNLKQNRIGDIGAKSLLSPLGNLLSLSSLNIDLGSNQIGHLGAKSLLSSLANLFNLQSLTLNLGFNQIGNIGAKFLLFPLTNLINLSSLTINLKSNGIEGIGAIFLLNPLANLISLSILNLFLEFNHIVDTGASSLLSPLVNLMNLSSLTINLAQNGIEDNGAKSLLSPLVNLLNLSSLTLDLGANNIRYIGAKSLLSPFSKHINLSSLSLNLGFNQIGDKGAQCLLSPLAKLLNLSNLSLGCRSNNIRDIGAQSLLSPLANLFNLSCLSLDLGSNKIEDTGAQYLLSPIKNLLSLQILSLFLSDNTICHIGNCFLFNTLFEMITLSSLDLQLTSSSNSKQTSHLFRHYFKKLNNFKLYY